MLGDVANLSITETGGVPQKTYASRAQGLLAQDCLQQHRLTRTVSPDHGDELPGLHRKVQIGPERSLAEGKRGRFDAQDAIHLVNRLLQLVNDPSHPVQVVKLLHPTAIPKVQITGLSDSDNGSVASLSRSNQLPGDGIAAPDVDN